MLRVTDLTALEQVHDYQMQLQVPYFIPTDFESWKESFENDVGGAGRTLFRTLHKKAAFDGDTLVGFIQYGNTAFGFDESGEISSAVSYPVIRSLYFDKDRLDAGEQLLRCAMEEFAAEKKVYAFFHYFGMSCFARHGKLFERYDWIEALLHRQGFVIEHENVYYSAAQLEDTASEVEVTAHDLTPGKQQVFDFMLDGRQIGGCEVHYLPSKGCAYLRWIYVNEELQNRGMGSKCMAALKKWLRDQGVTRLDTDTALDNARAQRYYEKNAFTRMGITRSFFLEK